MAATDLVLAMTGAAVAQPHGGGGGMGGGMGGGHSFSAPSPSSPTQSNKGGATRGLVETVLWQIAIDKQMKHEWNQLEFFVRSLTKLQPHFLTPWLFQSWNLAYNVSVESDRVRDKYFYISRGIELLAQGERRNHNNPDMRD